MPKTAQVKWLGTDEGPSQITQYGVIFKNGVFTTLPDDFDPKLLNKFRLSAAFEVEGDEPDSENYSVKRRGNGRGRSPSYLVIDPDGTQVGEEFAEEEAAVAKAEELNQAPVE